MCCHEFCQHVPHHSEDLAVLFIGMPLGCLAVSCVPHGNRAGWSCLYFVILFLLLLLYTSLPCFSSFPCTRPLSWHVCHGASDHYKMIWKKCHHICSVVKTWYMCMEALETFLLHKKKLRSTELTYIYDYHVHSIFLLEAFFWDVALTFTNSEPSLLLSATTILMVWQ